MATKRDRPAGDEPASSAGAMDEVGEATPRRADASGLGRPLAEAEDSAGAGAGARPDEAAREEGLAAARPKASPAPKKGKPRPATKAPKGVRAKRAMGPRGRQLARADRTERGKQRTAGVTPARRKAANPKSKAKPVKGSPKARRRLGTRGKKTPARRR